MSKATNNTNEQTVGNGYEIQADDVKMFTTKLGSRTGWSVSVCGTTAQNVVTAWDGQWMKVLIKIEGEWVKVGSFYAKSKGQDSMGRLIFDRTGARKQALACLKKFIGGMVIANLNLDCDWLEVAPASKTETTEEPAQAETVEVEEPAQAETVADHVVVTNDEGRAFSVVVVMQGDRYGLNDCLTHGSSDPLVEFYDAKHSGSVHGPLGQFVSRYYLSTLAGEDQWGLEPGQGLDLHGGVREWSVSWQNVCEAVAYARRRQAAA